jgi:hypothetical protein
MKRIAAYVALGLLVLGAIGAGAFFYLRGASGKSTLHGGSIDAAEVADFRAAEPSRWVNGAPASLASVRGAPVMVEVWSPG